MPEGFFSINISDFDGIWRSMAQKANLNGDGILDHNEVSIFNNMRKSYDPKTDTFLFEGKIYDAKGKEYNPANIKPEAPDALRIDNLKRTEEIMLARDKNIAALNKAANAEKEIKQYIASLIKAEVKQKIIIEQGVKKFSVDLKYWSDKIYKVATENNFPIEIIVAVISTETRGSFKKNLDGASGRGPMQITTSAINGFYPTAKGNWNNIYKKMDEKLLTDTLSYKDASPVAIRTRCAKDDEFGIKVGVLTFEIKYAQAVAELKFGKGNIGTIQKAIEGLKNGTIKLTPEENKRCIKKAFYLYNGNPPTQEKYSKTAMNSLDRMNFNFKNQFILDRK